MFLPCFTVSLQIKDSCHIRNLLKIKLDDVFASLRHLWKPQKDHCSSNCSMTTPSRPGSIFSSLSVLISPWITSLGAMSGRMPQRHLSDHYVSLSVPRYNGSYLEKAHLRAVQKSDWFIITVDGYVRACMLYFTCQTFGWCSLCQSNQTCDASGTGCFVSSHLSNLPPVAKRCLQKLMQFISTKGQLHLNLSKGEKRDFIEPDLIY